MQKFIWPLTMLLLIGLAAYTLFRMSKALPRRDKPIPGKRKIACIGDSITFGAGVVQTRDRDAWPYILGRSLGDAFQVLNYGISGAMAQVESEVVFKQYHDFIDDAVAADPELYLFMLGTNDCKTVNWKRDAFIRDYNAMLDRIEAGSPSASVVLMAPPALFPSGKDNVIAFGMDANVLQNEVVPLIKAIGEQRGFAVIDLYTFTDGHPEWFADGVHPNDAGNKAIADYLYAQLGPMNA